MQPIPPSTSLVSKLPSGRDIHPPPGPYTPPSLDEDQLARMRAMPSADEPLETELNDSDEADFPGRESPGTLPDPRNAAGDRTYY
jgi:hypothetical protein